MSLDSAISEGENTHTIYESWGLGPTAMRYAHNFDLVPCGMAFLNSVTKYQLADSQWLVLLDHSVLVPTERRSSPYYE